MRRLKLYPNAMGWGLPAPAATTNRPSSDGRALQARPGQFRDVPGARPQTQATLPRETSGLRTFLRSLLALLTLTCSAQLPAQTFRFPTGNHALLEPGGDEKFLAPTPGHDSSAGGFGCVRSGNRQMHEGIDILPLHHDRRGEPTDAVLAAADGDVAYVNQRPALSNYGNYVIVRHRIDRLDVFTLYAHLASIAAEMKAGARVKAGDTLGRMGRTTNTRTSIAKDRAHLHFEINLLVNEHFSRWIAAQDPEARNDHGPWNGRNLLGLDPGEILRLQAAAGGHFNLLDYIRNRHALFRVLVPQTSFPWLHRYPALIRRNPTAEREGIAAYELAMDYNGVPVQAIPRARSEIQGAPGLRLLSVDEEEQRRHPCRKLVFKQGQAWVLTAHGKELLSLLTY